MAIILEEHCSACDKAKPLNTPLPGTSLNFAVYSRSVGDLQCLRDNTTPPPLTAEKTQVPQGERFSQSGAHWPVDLRSGILPVKAYSYRGPDQKLLLPTGHPSSESLQVPHSPTSPL